LVTGPVNTQGEEESHTLTDAVSRPFFVRHVADI
jgi:hypothetical protein